MRIHDRFHTLKIILVDIAIILSVVMVFDPVVRDFVFFRPVRVTAVGVFNAIDLLGQFDEFGSADYTTATVNRLSDELPIPNERGLNTPAAVAIDDTDNRLFVADKANHRVLVFNLDGTNDIVDYVADAVIGQTDFETSDSDVDERSLYEPGGLAYDDANNRLFVSDTSNHRVLVFDASVANLASEAAGTGDATNAVNVIGQPDFYTANPETSQGGLSSPNGLAYDSPYLYVADTNNHRVMVFDVSSVTDGQNAVKELGQIDDNGNLDYFDDAVPATTQDEMRYPQDVATDGGNTLFVADTDNHRVLVYDVSAISDGESAQFELGQADDNANLDYFDDAVAQTDQDYLYSPVGVSYSSSGSRLFVSDRGNYRVMVFDVSTVANGEDAVNVIGQPTFLAVFSDTDQDRFQGVRRIAADASNDRLFVADEDNNRVMVFDVDPAVLIPDTPATDGPNATNLVGQVDDADAVDYSTNSADNQDHPFTETTTSAVGLNGAHGVAHDESGGSNVFVVDTGNNRVLVHTGGHPTSDGDADIVLGQLDMTASASATTDAGMRAPQGAVYDDDNDWLFVADTGNNRVLVFDGASLTDGMSALYVLGQASMTASVSATTATGMDSPTAVSVDDTGAYLYVADTGNNRVLIFNIASVADGEPAVNVIGQALFTTATAGTSQAGLDEPTGLAHDGTNLYVADTDNSRVMVFDVTPANLASSGDGMNAEHVLGQNNFSGGSGATTQDGLDGPSGVAYLPYASLLAVADTNNNRVMFFDVTSITDGEDAVQVIGQSDYVTPTGDTTQADFSFSGVSGLTFYDDEHILYVADAGNNRIMEFGLERITASSLPAASVGVPYGNSISHIYSQGTVTFTLASGSLPPGLSLTSAGTLPGTPTTSGTYTFTVQAEDAIGAGTFTDTKELSIAVSEPYQATNLLGQLTDDTDMPRWNGSQSYGFPNGLGLSYNQQGSAVDTVNHRFFLLDGYRVLVYNLDANNQFTDYIPDNVLGSDSVYAEYEALYAASASKFGSNAYALAFDGANNRLFVVGYGVHRVLMFDTTSITDGEDAVYVFGQTDFTTTTSGSGARKFNRPYDAVYDEANDRLYVAEQFNNRVLVFDASPANLASDGNGTDAFAVLGQTNFTNVTAATSQGRVSGPAGMVVNAAGTKLYLADSGNQRVLRFDVSTVTTGELAEAVLGQSLYTTSSSGLTAAKFNGPEDVALDDADNLLFVSDRANCRVMVFDVAGITNGESAVNVLGGSSLFTTASCATGNSGTRLEYFYPNKVYDVNDIVFDAGNSFLYVSDLNENRVVVYDTSSIVDGEAYISTVGVVTGHKTPELYANYYVSGRGMEDPGGIAIDRVGHQLFVVDKGNSNFVRTKRVLRYELDSNNNLTDRIADSVLGRKRLADWSGSSDLSPTASTTKVGTESGLVVDETNQRLFVADSGNNRVLIFDIASVSSGMLADYVLGQTTFTGASSALTQRGMNTPLGLAYDDTAQWLFVADSTNKRVLVYDVSPANLASDGNGSDAIAVLGQDNFTSNSSGPAIDRFSTAFGSGPSQLAYDAERHLLYVIDPANYRVMVFDVASITNGEDAVNVLGQTTFTAGSYLGPAQSRFATPTGIVFDPDNTFLWVADAGMRRVTGFDVISITNGENPISLLGQTAWNVTTNIVSQTRSRGPAGLALDPDNNRLYQVDYLAQRVVIYEFLENTTSTPASGSVGDLYSAALTATGEQGELSFSIASGSLPPGLSIVDTDIVGTPTTEGTYNFTLRAIDTLGVSTFVDDLEFSIDIGPAGSTGGGGTQTPEEVGFFPDRIVINDDAAEVSGYNVLVTVYAHFSEDFTGTVDVLLSNSPSFQTAIPFRYVVTRDDNRHNWQKTMAWDLCFGLPGNRPCEVGRKTVYARFYVNQERIRPAITPIGTPDL